MDVSEVLRQSFGILVSTPTTHRCCCSSTPSTSACGLHCLIAALLTLSGALAEADAAKLRWQPGTDHCKWPGVYCTDDNYVYLVDLSSQGIAGTLSDAVDLSALQELQSIWLQGNQLAGKLPASWFTLPSLRELLLYDNAIEVCKKLNIAAQHTYSHTALSVCCCSSSFVVHKQHPAAPSSAAQHSPAPAHGCTCPQVPTQP